MIITQTFIYIVKLKKKNIYLYNFKYSIVDSYNKVINYKLSLIAIFIYKIIQNYGSYINY